MNDKLLSDQKNRIESMTLKKNKRIRLLFYLPTVSNYQDRMKLIYEISKNTELTVLLVSKWDLPEELKPEADNFKIYECRSNSDLIQNAYFRASMMANKLMKEYRFNIIHDTFSHLLAFFLFNRQKQIHFLSSFYNLALYDFKHVLYPEYNWWKILLSKDLRNCMLRFMTQTWMTKLAQKIILQAPGLVERFSSVYPDKASKVSWIPNNLELEDQGNFLTKITEKEIVILWAGALNIGKGAITLLNLLKLAKEKSVKLKAIAMGGFTKADEKELKQLIGKYELSSMMSVFPKTSYEEMKKHYHNALFLFHMTRLDGSPRVVLEALASGLPVIATRHPGIKVFDEKEQFIVFAEENELIEVLDLIRDEHEDDAKYHYRSIQGREIIRKNFNSEVISQKYVDLYFRLLKRTVL